MDLEPAPTSFRSIYGLPMPIDLSVPSNNTEPPTLDSSGPTQSEKGGIHQDGIISIIEHIVELPPQELLEWSEQNLSLFSDFLVQECIRKGITSFQIDLNTGIKGAGKDTVSDTISQSFLEIATQIYNGKIQLLSPEDIELAELIREKTKKKINLITGTGGMFNHEPGNWYARTFGKLAKKLFKDYVSQGHYVPDSITNLSVTLALIDRVDQFASNDLPFEIEINLWPRTPGQRLYVESVLASISENGIEADLKPKHYMLSTPEVVELTKLNRTETLEAAKFIVSELKPWANSIKGINLDSIDNQYQTVYSKLQELYVYATRENDYPMIHVIGEISASIHRSLSRLYSNENKGKPIRNDDKPANSTARAIKDVEVAIDILTNEDVVLIPTRQEPGKVVNDVLRTHIPEHLTSCELYSKLIETAQNKIRTIVFGTNSQNNS